MKIEFTVPGIPVGKGRPRFMKNGHTYTPQKTRDYEDKVVQCWKCQSVFLEQWPEAFYREGLLQICPACVSRSFRGIVGECVVESKNCQKCKKDFWLAEVKDA